MRYYSMRTIIKRIFVIVIFLFTISLNINEVKADAAPLIGNVGRAPFSLTSPTFNCRAFLNSVKTLPVLHIAVLYNTFGNDFKCWDRLVKDKRLQTIELNLINEPGHRNKRLGNYEFLHNLGSPANYDKLLRNNNPKLKAKFVKYVSLAKRKINELPPNVQCLINPGLESNVSDAAGKVLIDWTKEQFPNCRTVWNPLNGFNEAARRRTGADLVEGHGILPPLQRPCLVNLDGADIDFPTRPTYMPKGSFIESGRPLMNYISTYANKCEIVFLWVVEDNCNFKSSFIDPRKRNCRGAGKAFDLVAKETRRAMKTIRHPIRKRWNDEENKSLNSCSEVRSPNDGDKRGFLLKQSEFRYRGGVIVLPGNIRARSVRILSNGALIDTYRQNGFYTHDGASRPLWRSGNTPNSYPFNVVVEARTSAGTICYKIDNPTARND
jgi:hypothetical protein